MKRFQMILKKVLVRLFILIVLFIILDTLFFHFLLNRPKNYEINRKSQVFSYDKTTKPLTLLNDDEVVGYETEKVELVIDPKTSGVSLRNKLTGEVWTNRATDVVNLIEKDYAMSAITLDYITIDGNIQTLFSYKNAVLQDNVSYYQLNNGLRVKYVISNQGKIDFSRIPKLISVSRFREKILAQLENTDKTRIQMIYTYNARYDYYEIRDFYNISSYDYERVLEVFKKVNYTQDDVNYDNKTNSFVPDIPPHARFDIAIDYIIDENGDLIVIVPNDLITENEDNLIKSIKLFPYFLKATNNDTGYMLVPDGTGALIKLNNGKLRGNNYYQPIYSADTLFNLGEGQELVNEQALMPIYGMITHEKSILAIIEGGAEIASVGAEVSGKSNVMYNRINSDFDFRRFKKVAVIPGSNNYLRPLWNKDKYDKDIVVRYKLFDFEDNIDYSKMAFAYQEYLVNKYNLKPVDHDKQVFIDFLGSIEMKNYFLGVPYQSDKSLTTYEDIKKIIESLKDREVNHLSISILGWMNNGLNQQLASDIELMKVLGSQKELNQLITYMNENHYPIYLDVSFSKHYDSNQLGSQLMEMSSRTIDNQVAKLYPYNPVTLKFDESKTPYMVLSPEYLLPTTQKFIREFDKLGLTNLSVADLGQHIYPTYKFEDEVYYGKSLDAVKNSLEVLDKYTLMVRGGFEYSLGYTNVLADVPLESNNDYKVDTNIPFLQMAYSGYADLFSQSVNLSDDRDENWYLLKALETGTNLKYTLTYEDSSILKNTEFNYFYATHYKNWLDRIESAYSVLSQISSTKIIYHQIIEENVFLTEYADGTKVYVNYNSYPVNLDQLNYQIQAMSYFIH